MPITLHRTIWPVGHGAFYTEQFIDEDTNNVLWTAVYDCGGKDTKIVEGAIDAFLTDCCHQQGVDEKPQIDIVFISHFHADHINGLEYLHQRANIKRLALPQLTKEVIAMSVVEIVAAARSSHNETEVEILQNIEFLKRLQSHDFGDTHIIEVQQVEPQDEYPSNERPNNNEEQPIFEEWERHGVSTIDSGTKIPIAGLPLNRNARMPYWVYVPVNIYASKQNLLQNLLQDNLGIQLDSIMNGNYLDIDKLNAELEKKTTSDIDAAYRNVFAYRNGKTKDANIYSMPVYSGIDTHALLRNTAIYDIDIDIYPDIYEYFYRYWIPSKYWHHRHRLFKRSLCCLYMGDFRAYVKKNMKSLIHILGCHWDMVGTQQVPHHFSIHNHNIDLYDDVKVTFGNVDDHGDISFTHSVARDISMYCGISPLIVTEQSHRLVFRSIFGL